MNPLTIVGPYGNTWYFTSEYDFYGGETCYNDDSVGDVDGDTCSDYYDYNPDSCGGYDTEDFIAARECCICGGGSTGYYEDSFDWWMYLTNPDVDGYGIIWTDDSTYNTLYLWDESGATCTLTTDWKSDDPMEGAWGFFVSDPDGTCPYVEEQGWTYAWYETDEDLNPLTIVGPYGNTWYFTSEEDFYGGETCYNNDFIGDVDGDTCSGYYDFNPDSCGGYDTEDFIAANECCICGGGSYEE